MQEEIKKQPVLGKVWSNVKFFFTHPNMIYCLKRIGSGLITLFLICTAVFLLLRMVPKTGYYDQEVLRKLNTQEAKQNYMDQIDKRYGFDKPIVVQLLSFYRDILPIPTTYCVKDSFKDNTYSEIICREEATRLIYLGKSLIVEKNVDVSTLMAEKFPISMAISLISTVLTYLVGYPLGVIMAKNKGKAADKAGNAWIVLNLAIPGLVFYFILWRLFLMMGFPGTYTKGNIVALIPPIIAMTILSIPGTAMWVRRFMVDEGDADYVRFARSKGLSENKIMFTHVLRNAAVPLVRNIPAAFIGSIVGSYYIENVWSIPGTGRLLITAMDPSKPDNSLVQGLVIIYAAISMISFILGDIATVFADPRIKLVKK